MKKISLRIRTEYFEAIQKNEKTVEYRSFTPFWKRRLQGLADFYTEAVALLRKHSGDGDFPNGDKQEEAFKKDVHRFIELMELREAEAVFLCGKNVLRRKIVSVKHIPTPTNIDKRAVRTPTCYAIGITCKE